MTSANARTTLESIIFHENKHAMSEIKNITDQEFPVLAEVALEENDGDIAKSAQDIRKIDLMLGVMKQKTLLLSGRRTKKGRLRKIPGLDEILENIIERDDL